MRLPIEVDGGSPIVPVKVPPTDIPQVESGLSSPPSALDRVADALERVADAADLWAKPSSTPTWDLSKPPPTNPGLRSNRLSRRQRKKAQKHPPALTSPLYAPRSPSGEARSA